jgi:hypothetical protein
MSRVKAAYGDPARWPEVVLVVLTLRPSSGSIHASPSAQGRTDPQPV